MPARSHGMCRTKIYDIWSAMVQRCCNPDSPRYADYGARGIGISEEWRNSFETFYRDMGERPEGKSLDRIDNEQGYSKENCQWSTHSEQRKNSRTSRKITYLGRTQSLCDWAFEIGVNESLIRHRLNKGWDIERAMNPQRRVNQFG